MAPEDAGDAVAEACSMYTCQDSINLLLDYLDGEMPKELAAELREHLSGCEPCEDFLRSYQATPKLCRRALEARMPEAVARSLTSFLRTRLGCPGGSGGGEGGPPST